MYRVYKVRACLSALSATGGCRLLFATSGWQIGTPEHVHTSRCLAGPAQLVAMCLSSIIRTAESHCVVHIPKNPGWGVSAISVARVRQDFYQINESRKHLSCEIEDFVEAHVCKLRVVLRSRVLFTGVLC